MSLEKAVPVHFTARSVCDSIDPTAPGSMAVLQNLIIDVSTDGVFNCRPAQLPLTTFSGFTTPGVVSCSKVVGNRLFGMVGSGRFAGKDEPFVYDLVTNAFITISGVTNANTPFTPAAVGSWTPPTIDAVGSKVLVTHPGFLGVSGCFFGVFDVSTPATPAWSATNTTGNALPSIPVAVAQFNNRAYWLVNPAGSPSGVYASDVLQPTACTNLYVLNFDDLIPCTAMAGLPMNNQLGGIIQSIMVFKGTTNVYQIQGDPSTGGNWSRNTLNINTGTLSPRSIAITPEGLAFMAPDGLRMINFTGNITEVIGSRGEGVVIPFIAPVDQSRICGAANASVYRVSVKPALSNTWCEYWYHFSRKVWTGPHTCPMATLTNYNNTFIGAPETVSATIVQSDYVQISTSTFMENGANLTWIWATSILPDTQQMAEAFIVESTLNLALLANSGTTPVATITVSDGQGTQLGVYSISIAGTLWGSNYWGDGTIWGGGNNGFYPRPLNFSQPIVFRKLSYSATGLSSSGFKVGDLYMRYQQTGYLQQ